MAGQQENQPEIIVVLKPSAALNAMSGEVPSSLAEFGATLRPVFPIASVPRSDELSGQEPPSAALSDVLEEQRRYYYLDVSSGDAQPLIERLKQSDLVETVYVKPAVENPLGPPETLEAATSSLTGGLPPDFAARQSYLNPATDGVDPKFAWAVSGGRGAGVRIIDIEGGWQFSHIDLLQNQGGLGTPYPDVHWRNHGTAVFGEIIGTVNGFGITGISPDANICAVSHGGGLGSAGAIQLAALRLRAGDIILLEMHRPGPRHGFAGRPDQLGYIAVEWWPDDLLAIRAAVARGIIVVEAAGNGAENLDDALYEAPGPGFPASWRNPFRGTPDSGAVVVGAGAPPSGLHGPDRSRLGFSNFGSRVDCQGWGRGVVTTGYNDLFKHPTQPLNEDYWYTATFSGTSSASPIVVGAVACLQGVAKHRGRTLMPQEVRHLLRTTGSPQQAGVASPVSQRIGSRPDLRQMLGTAFGIA